VAVEEATKYEQLKTEVSYRTRVKSAGSNSFKVILALALLVALGSCLYHVFIEKESFREWAVTFRWRNLLLHLFFWTLIYYFILSQKGYHHLISKQRELHKLLLQNPKLEK
jgi:hypothetical protein